MSDPSTEIQLDEVLRLVCRRYIDGEIDIHAHLLPHICRRLLEFLNPKQPTKRGRNRTTYKIAGEWVEFMVTKKGIPMMDARAIVADIMQWPRDKIGQAHRDYRPKKK